ncbi:hypothetical protein EK21DRAFT_85512 [Setomelanomma holmii]|uniref:Uncharacterized protein n=1 Tax=Setomelanomma holmii TaxID=210430 RepID=A0A9P4HK62_9PLEO|nr:hypothetical protein EK21DRAFT_85512 [Setomelanomma holmii]
MPPKAINTPITYSKILSGTPKRAPTGSTLPTITRPKHLLGVLIPTTKPPLNADYGDMPPVPCVDAPPLSADRRAEFDTTDVPDYTGFSNTELKDFMKERGIGLRGCPKRMHWVKALEGPAREKREEYQAWKIEAARQIEWQRKNPDKVLLSRMTPKQREERKEPDWATKMAKTGPESYLRHEYMDDRVEYRAFAAMVKQRQSLMFRSDFKEEPGRTSFLDLPPEIRNTIYRYALFGCYTLQWKINVKTEEGRLLPWHRELGIVGLQEELTIAALDTLSAMSKQASIQRITEAWGAILEIIGPEGCANISTLIRPHDSFPAPSPKQHTVFQGLLRSLVPCQRLKVLVLDVHVSNIFRGDVEELKAFFLHGKALDSPGLHHVAGVLAFLPSLIKVDFNMRSRSARYEELDDDTECFLQFAFSGLREMMLFLEIKEELQANYVRGGDGELRKFCGKTWVSMNYDQYVRFDEEDETLDYGKWINWYTEMHPVAEYEEGVVVLRLDDAVGDLDS